MTIQITSDSLVSDLQEEFRERFPFLKIAFFATAEWINNHKQKSNKLVPGTRLGDVISGRENNRVQIFPSMTVQALEVICEEQLGIFVQLSRKFGNSWMEISMTNAWTIQQQNERGREICSIIYKETQDNNGLHAGN